MKRIIAIVLSIAMALTSVVAFAAPSDADRARSFIEVFTDGTGVVTREDLEVNTLVGKTTPDLKEVGVSKGQSVIFKSTLDMNDVALLYTVVNSALALENPETQALFVDAELDGQFVITIECDEDLDYSMASREFTNLEPTVFAEPVYEDTVVTVDTKEGLLFSDLSEGLLHDIEYVVDGVKTNVVGTHDVIVVMTGYVNVLVDDEVVGRINFSTLDNDVNNKAAVRIKTSDGGAIKHTVTFETNGGSKISPVEVFDKQKVVLPADPTREGFTFEGWFEDEALTIPFNPNTPITKDITIYAKWTLGEGVVGGGTADVIVKGEPDKEISTGGDVKVSELEVPEREGFIFGGWYEDPGYNSQLDGDNVIKAGDKVYGRWINVTVPEALEDTNHFAYIIGYPDETVRPQNNVSREEVATMFYRLMKPSYRAEKLTRENEFDDIEAGRWSEKAVATMTNAGFINGYPEGDFRPENSITRAEFATIAARMFANDYDKKYAGKFNDISGHWAEEYILKLSAYECIYGYEDGSFKPDAKITRAEAIAIINRIIVRYVNHEGLHKYTIQWIDNLSSQWYYFPVLEATNSHDYSRQEDYYNEDWHKMNDNIDWEADQYN